MPMTEWESEWMVRSKNNPDALFELFNYPSCITILQHSSSKSWNQTRYVYKDIFVVVKSNNAAYTQQIVDSVLACSVPLYIETSEYTSQTFWTKDTLFKRIHIINGTDTQTMLVAWCRVDSTEGDSFYYSMTNKLVQSANELLDLHLS
jgi:hypothetical protein